MRAVQLDIAFDTPRRPGKSQTYMISRVLTIMHLDGKCYRELVHDVIDVEREGIVLNIYYIEGYDVKNFGDLSMALSALLLVDKAGNANKIVLPRVFDVGCDLALIKKSKVIFRTGKDIYNKIPFVRKFFRRRNSFRLSEESINSGGVILYCCGYIFGDGWSLSHIEEVIEDFVVAKKNGCKIMLMPQSFGPFEHDGHRAAVKRLMQTVDLAYSRDEKSYEYASQFDARKVLSRSVDYTGVLNEIDEFAPGDKKNRLCMIPNNKILEKYGASVVDEYVEYMCFMASRFKEISKCEVYLLRHTLGKDDYIISEIQKKLLGCELVEPASPLSARKFIGESEMVLTSRFHGLMHALTQGVPVITIGWSHKYNGAIEMYSNKKYSIQLGGEVDLSSLCSSFVSELDNLRVVQKKQQSYIEEKYYKELVLDLRSLETR